MGQKDLTGKNFILYPDVYADTINALAYAGREVVHAKDLLPAPTESFYHVEQGKLTDHYKSSEQKIVHPEALLLILKALTGDKRYLTILSALTEEERRGVYCASCWINTKTEGYRKEYSRGNPDSQCLVRICSI